MKQVLLMIGLVALLGCGKNDPPPPDTSSLPDSNSSMAEMNMPEKETGKEVTQPTTPNIEATNPEPKVDPTKHGRFIWKFETGDDVTSSPAIGSDGTVYVRSDDTKLYAIKTDSKGLAKSPWPMRGQNARHMGRALEK